MFFIFYFLTKYIRSCTEIDDNYEMYYAHPPPPAGSVNGKFVVIRKCRNYWCFGGGHRLSLSKTNDQEGLLIDYIKIAILLLRNIGNNHDCIIK